MLPSNGAGGYDTGNGVQAVKSWEATEANNLAS